MTRAFVGLGSNVGDSPGILREALARLSSLGTSFVNSDLYLAQPWGKTDQPAFYNAVAAFDTDYDPQALLERLAGIENEFGRVRSERWGPRTLDLDLLLYGEMTIADPACTVPHTSMRARAFVLAPLAEIASSVRIPPHASTAQKLLEELPARERASVRRLRGTSVLSQPPRVDYDAAGGAGARYDDLRPFSPFDRIVLDGVIEAAGPLPGRRVLDVGCGTGRFSLQLAKAGATVTGIDRSERMLSAARSNSTSAGAPAIDYVRGDANESMPRGPFDVITAFYCIQYIDVESFCVNAFERLSPDGVLAIATFPHRHFAETEYARFFPSLSALDMARFPSVPALDSALRRARFTDIAARDRKVEMVDNPAVLIERVQAKYLSSFYLLSDAEFRKGIAAMRLQWQGVPTVRRAALSVVVSGRRPIGGR